MILLNDPYYVSRHLMLQLSRSLSICHYQCFFISWKLNNREQLIDVVLIETMFSPLYIP